jgi:hypothetical protein
MKDIFDGSKKLLNESIEIIGDAVNDIILVGGWGPYIRHSQIHPGTSDVDLLFPATYTKEDTTAILQKFLSQGYYISAKHDFQLCRAFQIGQQTYIYNVDLLHPTDGKVNKVDFVEIMDLDVTNGIRVKTMLSVNIQYGEEIYSNELYSVVEFENQKFKVLDGAGMVISKLNSCHNKKRLRDIFDIYLSLSEKGTRDKLINLGTISPIIKANFSDYNNKLTEDPNFYLSSLKTFGVINPKLKEILI